jgi:enoyl-[acyl-carrier-protein] reductase (NADH)
MVGWVTALKLVPWGDVIEATPQILQAAKKLLGTARKSKADTAATTSLGSSEAEAQLPAATQMQHLRERVAQLEQEQMDSAALIQSLAQQNAQVIQAVDDLRQRYRRLTMLAAALGCICLGLLVAVIRQ